jgi:membrane protease YdiL (CAAX protease family)
MKEPISSTQKALNLWAVILIVWSLYRANFHLPEYVDEFIAKPLVFIVPVYFYIRNIDKKNFFNSIGLKLKSIPVDFFVSLLIGLIFFGAVMLANLLKTGKVMLSPQNIIIVVVTALATSISEEILSRGFILKKLYDESKNIYSACFIGSILFFLLHIPILMTTARLTGNLLLMFMALDIIFSLVVSFIFLQRKSLALPIFIHAFYIIALTMFI